MNKRKRKKWLKQHNKYVPHSELWNLDCTICEWIVPRLKEFKKINFAYPGREPYDTFDKWQAAIDKMIRAFELAGYDPIDLDENLEPLDHYDFDVDKYKIIYAKWKAEVDEGFHIFIEYFHDLWI